mmetsp:Transcript_19536/g.45522  ORF Transcript_19536/g.45522 Transcript_19536/m.45522 type:complete len:410 (+) Transcript_19536:3050-4279(+)
MLLALREDGLEISVGEFFELVHDGNPRGNRHVLDLLVADVVDGLDQPPQRVGVRHHQDVPALFQLEQDLLVPQRLRPFHAVQEGFRQRHLIRGEVRVLAVPAGIVGIELRQGRRAVAETPPPALDQVFAEALRGLGLVEARQGSVETLVEPPTLEDRQVHCIELLQENPGGPNRSLEPGCKDDVYVVVVAPLHEKPGSVLDLALSLVREVGIGPAGERLVLVPLALTVPNEYERPGFHRAPRQNLLGGPKRQPQRLLQEGSVAPPLLHVGVPVLVHVVFLLGLLLHHAGKPRGFRFVLVQKPAVSRRHAVSVRVGVKGAVAEPKVVLIITDIDLFDRLIGSAGCFSFGRICRGCGSGVGLSRRGEHRRRRGRTKPERSGVARRKGFRSFEAETDKAEQTRGHCYHQSVR